jgi:hypothetical protein
MERMEEYYALLNCGFRIPIGAGSGATETGFSGEDHLGSSRIYARMFSDFSLGGFIRTVRRGQSWATNGPALTLLVNGKDPSETLDLLTLNRTLDVSFGARSNRRIDRVELIHNGEVVRTLPGSATSSHVMESFRYDVPEPGWLAARVFEVQETPESVFRYAHTSPFYLNVRGQPNYRKETVQDFATRIAQSIRRIEDNETIPEQEKQQVLTWYRQASDKYLEKLR